MQRGSGKERGNSKFSFAFVLFALPVGGATEARHKDAKTNECETKIYRIDLKDVVVVVEQ